MNTLRINAVSLLAALCLVACAVPNDAVPPNGPGARAGEAKPAYRWSRSMESKRVAIQRATRDSGIAVLRTEDNQLQINVPSDFSFGSGSAAIAPGMHPVLDELAQDLEARPLSKMLILVVGHTDSRGPDAVNEALSLARATNVGNYLSSKGIAPARITVQGRGERDPEVGNDKSYERALNRRVEIFLREPEDGM